MGGEMRGSSVDDHEFDMLLNEIPHATSHNVHHHVHPQHGNHNHNHHHLPYDGLVRGLGHASAVAQKMNGLYNGNGNGVYGMFDDDTLSYTRASPVSGFSLQSGGSSSSLFSGGYALSDTESPTPPPLEELKSPLFHGVSNCPNGFWLDPKIPDSNIRNRVNESLVDELGLCRNLSRMYISNGQEETSHFRGSLSDQYGVQSCGSKRFDAAKYGACHKFGDCSPGYASNLRVSPVEQYGFRFHGSSPKESSGINVEKFGAYNNYAMADSDSDYMGLQYSGPRTPLRFDGKMSSGLSSLGNLLGSQSPSGRSDHLFSQSNVCNIPMSSSSRLSMADCLLRAQHNGTNMNEDRPVFGSSNQQRYGMPMSNEKKIRMHQRPLEAFADEDSFIIQGQALDHARTRYKGSLHEIGIRKRPERRSQSQQGYIYLIAKDQNGCRFLQKMFEEGSPRDVQIIFSELIDHVVELMMNPFGNYLMQKLLDVCTEEQRMHILLVITEKPGELIRISLNMHGTRVVQKLIETLKTRQQISLVVSALQPGVHSLLIDVNGNHVVQRCLQCLSIADNKFIFVAAAKHCVDIGTHQHGCCVLQRCISHSSGQHRENLVAEISANGLLLAQDSFGNYVVQFILELKIPSAISNLASQFEGNYVHLATHRFSSHVVEKCLVVFNERNRARIIHELLSVSHFEQLLQDPHANYVVQTALRVSEGHLQSLLVEAIEAHRGVARNSPYAKKIFSQKLLRK